MSVLKSLVPSAYLREYSYGRRQGAFRDFDNHCGADCRADHEANSGLLALPWSNTNLNRVLLRNATQNVSATFAFVQKLSQAKNFEEVAKIQTEFMEAQMQRFNEQAKILGEIYAKAAEDAVKAPFDVSNSST
jgi:Phasin protein